MQARQLTLDVTLPDGSDFDAFHAGANGLALDSLRALARGEGERQLYLYGEPGSGKTHLLQAACHEASLWGRRAAYLPAFLLRQGGAHALEGLDQLDLVCLDGISALVGCVETETGLFNLINASRCRDTRLVLADTHAPRALSAALPDLGSRLVWGPVFQLQPLDDAGKRVVLVERARRRGFELPGEVGEFLLRTCARDLATLMVQLERLEQASLRDQRRVTLPFARAVLGEGVKWEV